MKEGRGEENKTSTNFKFYFRVYRYVGTVGVLTKGKRERDMREASQPRGIEVFWLSVLMTNTEERVPELGVFWRWFLGGRVDGWLSRPSATIEKRPGVRWSRWPVFCSSGSCLSGYRSKCRALLFRARDPVSCPLPPPPCSVFLFPPCSTFLFSPGHYVSPQDSHLQFGQDGVQADPRQRR